VKFGYFKSWPTGVVLCASLLLASCTGTADLGDGEDSAVAGLVVEGVQNDSTCHLPINSTVLVSRLVDLVNQERTSRGLHSLTLSGLLSDVADNYSCVMIENSFFAHNNPYTDEGPGQRAIDEGYLFLAIGENLAAGQETPEQVVLDWMSSAEGHRENILAAQWQELGIGIRTGGEYGVYWVLLFGNPP
jgi:uncharacterized protein YkwD